MIGGGSGVNDNTLKGNVAGGEYMPLSYGRTYIVQSEVAQTIQVAGTVSNLVVHLSNIPTGTDSWEFVVMHNGSATTVSCTINTGESTCAVPSSGTESFAADDTISVRAMGTGDPTDTAASWTARLSQP